jgi:alkylation response protein AidB-like acyl-CoA dehydrogenase
MYELSAEAKRLFDSASDIARNVALPVAADVDTEARFPKESIDALGSGGLMGLCVSAAAGGLGEGPRTFAAVVDELATACGSTAMIYVMHVTAAQAIASASSLQERDAILRAIAEGKHLTTLAFSEKGSRSQFWAPVSQLERSNGHFVTSASKSWVTAAKHADSFVSSAQIPGAESPLQSLV